VTVESGDANGTTVRVRREVGGAWLMINDPANLDYAEVWLDGALAAEVAAGLSSQGER
jgi:hypothetical protein